MTVERETMDFDVLLVGAGPANLTCAIHLMSLIEKHNKDVTDGLSQEDLIDTEDKIAIIEKGAYVGAHGFSGAVMDPITIKEFMPDFLDRGFPYESEVTHDEVYWLGKKKAYRFPILPPSFKNHGNYIISLSKVTAWLAGIAEEKGVVVLPGYSGVKLLYDKERVTGVQTDDRAVNDDGIPQEPGYQLNAKVTVLGEGPKGTLTRQLIPKFGLDKDKNVSGYELGCKEVWELPKDRVDKGKVVHTLGYPLDRRKPGGGFIYHLSDNRLALGFVTYLSSSDPFLDTHRELQNWKGHPYLLNLLKGGKAVYYGAKVVPSSGYYSIPKLTVSGAMILGDSANLVNTQRLKGIHLAMKSGMLAAETIFEALKNKDFTDRSLSQYESRFVNSTAKKELYKVRNFSQAMTKGFPFPAVYHIGFQMITGGTGLFGRLKAHDDADSTQPTDKFNQNTHLPQALKSDGITVIDKLSDVFLSNTSHNERQTSHIRIKDPSICVCECYPKYKAPCTCYCPANVYEMIENEDGKQALKVNFANCVHCKAADIKCPFKNISWGLPEGGDGPKYIMM